MPKSTFKNLDSDRQEHFWDCSLKVFAQRGYDGASVSHVARACNISKSLIYCYFEDKIDLYDSLSLVALSRLRSRLYRDRLEDKDIFTIVEAFFVRGAEICRDEPNIFLLYFQGGRKHNEGITRKKPHVIESKAATVLNAKIREGLRLGTVNPAIDAQACAYLIHSAYLSFCSSLLEYRHQIRLATFLEQDHAVSMEDSEACAKRLAGAMCAMLRK